MTSRQIRLITLLLFLSDIPLTMGATVVKLPLPGWLTSSWPLVLLFAGAVNHGLHIYFDPVMPAAVPPTVTPLVAAPLVTTPKP